MLRGKCILAIDFLLLPLFLSAGRAALKLYSPLEISYCPKTLLNACIFFFSFLVYDGRGTLEEGETAEARFIKIQAAYELLIDDERRKQYDNDNRVNPMKVTFVSILSVDVPI